MFDRCGNRFLCRWILDGEGYQAKGDCNICANGKLPSDSATCVDCGLSRKNYKPINNYDRLISKTPEELAEWIESIEPAACPWRYDHGENCPYTDCLNCWISWLKAQAEEGEG